MGDFNTYWRMTINNYDERDLALVRQGYPDDIRKLVYTLEEGESGTPHIQAYIQMKRSVRLSHMKKLFPGANFASQTSAEWRLNQHNYAQKLDPTARSPAVIQNNDPLHTIEGTLRRVIEAMCPDIEMEGTCDRKFYEFLRKRRESKMVAEDYTLAKVFVSSTYRSMWREFGVDMVACILRRREAERTAQQESRVEVPTTHTHTHADEKFSLAEDIHDGEGSEEGESDCGYEDGEGLEEDVCSEASGSDETGSVSSGSSNDSEE